MTRLYIKIYLTIVASLLAVVLVSSIVWRIGNDRFDGPPFSRIGAELVSIALPPADAPAEAQQRRLAEISERLGIDLALFDANRRQIAAAGRIIRFPEGRWRGRRGLWRERLDDGRWIVARLHFGPRRPFLRGLTWLAAIALLVALCAYPIVRGLTRRLERLQTAVETLGSGDLGARVEVRGRDEVARLATSFNTAADHIERLVDSHRQLLAHASHELRTPLARIRMGIELMQQDPTGKRREDLEADIAELDALIDEILLASRLDSGRPLEREEDIDLLALAAEECARDDTCRLSGTPSHVHGDPRLLRRAIRNLLDNARKHGAPPIDVSVLGEAGRVRLIVVDHGPGIPEAERERVFTPFYRMAKDQQKTGSGLGLSLVDQIASRHGGSVAITESRPGHHEVTLELPALLDGN